MNYSSFRSELAYNLHTIKLFFASFTVSLLQRCESKLSFAPSILGEFFFGTANSWNALYFKDRLHSVRVLSFPAKKVSTIILIQNLFLEENYNTHF